MTNLLQTRKFTPSNFYIEKIIRQAFYRVPRSINFASNYVRICSKSTTALDECLEDLGEVLWMDNKIVLFSTWSFWFAQIINKLGNTLRRSGEQRIISPANQDHMEEEEGLEIRYPPST